MTDTSQHDIDICIIGAGPVGAAFACALVKLGIKVAIIDKSSLKSMENPSLDGRAYAIAAGPYHYLQTQGIWQYLPTEPCPIEEIFINDDRVQQQTPSPSLTFDHNDADQPFGWMVRARTLRIALNKALTQACGLHLYAPATVQHIAFEDTHASIELSTGEHFRAGLVVAADGRNSFLRRQVGIPLTKIPYHQTAMVGVMAHEKPHYNGALEHFLAHGPFAQLPLKGDEEHPHLSAYVWSETAPNAERYLAMSDTVFSRQLKIRLGRRDLGEIKVLNPKWSYPLWAQYAMRYTSTRLILVGDAAHGVHPIAGQGLNLGYRDIRILTQLFKEAHQQGADFGDPRLLRRYQQLCRPANMLMLGATDLLDNIFSNDHTLLRPIRNFGLFALSKMPMMRRKFVKYAMGI